MREPNDEFRPSVCSSAAEQFATTGVHSASNDGGGDCDVDRRSTASAAAAAHGARAITTTATGGMRQDRGRRGQVYFLHSRGALEKRIRRRSAFCLQSLNLDKRDLIVPEHAAACCSRPMWENKHGLHLWHPTMAATSREWPNTRLGAFKLKWNAKSEYSTSTSSLGAVFQVTWRFALDNNEHKSREPLVHIQSSRIDAMSSVVASAMRKRPLAAIWAVPRVPMFGPKTHCRGRSSGLALDRRKTHGRDHWIACCIDFMSALDEH